MAKSTHIGIGRVLLQLALGLMLTIAGIWALMGGGDDGVGAIRSLINDRTIEQILVICYGVIELIAGVFLVLALFMGDRFGSFGSAIMIIIMIVWIITIVLIDFLGGNSIFHRRDVLSWIYQFSKHLIVLGALIYLKD